MVKELQKIQKLVSPYWSSSWANPFNVYKACPCEFLGKSLPTKFMQFVCTYLVLHRKLPYNMVWYLHVKCSFYIHFEKKSMGKTFVTANRASLCLFV